MTEYKLMYDVASVPDGVTLERIVRVWMDYKIIIYDSNKGDKPQLIDSDQTEVLVDISTLEEEKLKQIQKLLK